MSDLLGRLNRLLIVPVHRIRRASLASTHLGRPFFWSPPEDDLTEIRKEWERFREMIDKVRLAIYPRPRRRPSSTCARKRGTHGTRTQLQVAST